VGTACVVPVRVGSACVASVCVGLARAGLARAGVAHVGVVDPPVGACVVATAAGV